MKQFLYFIVDLVARIHDRILMLNDGFPTIMSDKQLHFLVIGVLGMLLFMLIHPLFKSLVKHGHVIAISWFYVFTLILVLTFAIEIGQQVTHTGSMEFEDIVFGVFGFLIMFTFFTLIRGIVMLLSRPRKKRAAQKELS